MNLEIPRRPLSYPVQESQLHKFLSGILLKKWSPYPFFLIYVMVTLKKKREITKGRRMLGLYLVFQFDRIGSLGWLMTRFRVKGILVIIPRLSRGPRKQRLYIDVIGNLRLRVRGESSLSRGSEPHGGRCESKIETYGERVS